MKNLKIGLKKYYKFILLICLIGLCICCVKSIDEVILFKKIDNQIELERIEKVQPKKRFYFYKSDCSVCKKYKKNIHKLVQRGLLVYGFDISNSNINKLEVIDRYNLNEVPTVVIIKNEKCLLKIEGYCDYSILLKKISNNY